jgi:hypothetical protein
LQKHACSGRTSCGQFGSSVVAVRVEV